MPTVNSLRLYLSGTPGIGRGVALERVEFSHSELAKELISTRGDNPEDINFGRFRWTPAVQAISLLILRYLISETEDAAIHVTANLSGVRGSPAATLDYALSKQPAWMLDMFGMDYHGVPLIRNFLSRRNPERKRPGPVVVSVDERVLPKDSIEIFLDGEAIRSPELLLKIIRDWEQRAKTTKGISKSESSRGSKPANVQAGVEDHKSIGKESKYTLKIDYGKGVLAIRSLLVGFGISLMAAFFWGLGNIVTRWTAHRAPSASFDIAFIKYLSATFFVLASVAYFSPRDRSFGIAMRKTLSGLDKAFFAAAISKAINTYSWVLSVSMVSAGTTTVLENLHVVWTALAVVLLFGESLPGSWIVGSLTVTIGAYLVVGGDAFLTSASNVEGMVLGLISGLAFSAFIVSWNRKEHSELLSERTLEMGILLALATLLMYPLHILVSPFLSNPNIIPLTRIPATDAFVQSLNGMAGIGLTYLLVNEACRVLDNAGNVAALLLAIGLSFAVPITFVAECLFLGSHVSSIQILGVVLFVIGFTTVRTGILKTK